MGMFFSQAFVNALHEYFAEKNYYEWWKGVEAWIESLPITYADDPR